jgi:hypothetical protein
LTESLVERAISVLRAPWPVVLAVSAVVVGVAGLSELVAAHLSGTTSGDFFTVCATVAPLFGLAVFVDIALVMGPVVGDQGATPANRALVQVLVRTNMAMLVISESAALYSVGVKASSAFLVVCSVLPWVVQLYLLLGGLGETIGEARGV